MPHVVVIAGPNGAGKSTIAPRLLVDVLGITQFVNADIIAQEISPKSPETVALTAGKLMLRQLSALAEADEDFAFETTLSTLSFYKSLQAMRERGYLFYLIFLSLPDVDMAVFRVADRVANGGHDIPPDVIERRYHKGLTNFFHIYAPIADRWLFYDNSTEKLDIIAKGSLTEVEEILDAQRWKDFGLNTMRKSDQNKSRIDDVFADEKSLTNDLQKAIHDAIAKHKKCKKPIVIWEGEPTWVDLN